MKTYEIIAKKQPRWYQARWRISNLLVKLARWVYPENPEVKAFYLKCVADAMVYGGCVTKLDMSEVYKHD